MKEIFDITFSAVNIVPAALLLFVVVYWLIVIIGLIDLDTIHIHLDSPDHDHFAPALDIDHSHSSFVKGATGEDMGVSWFNGVLSFFNLGKVPFMIFLSFLAFPMWIFSIVINHYLNNHSLILSFIFLIPNFIGSLFISKFCTMPFVKMFGKLDTDVENNHGLVGYTGVVVLPVSPDKIGQIEVLIDKASQRFYAVSKEGRIENYQTVLIVDYYQDQRCYLVEIYEQ